MRKILCIIGLLLSMQTSFAQNLLDLGVKVGVNISQLRNFTLIDDASPRVGVVGGVWLRINTPIWGLYVQPEVLASQSGEQLKNVVFTDATGNLLPGEGKIKYNLTNIEVPVLIGKKIGIAGLNLRAFVGPVFSHTLSYNTEFNLPQGEVVKMDVPNTNDLRVGLQTGLGLDLANFYVDARYHHEFSYLAMDSPLKASALQLSLGYKLL